MWLLLLLGMKFLTSSDGTIRIWDITKVQDMIVLEMPNSSACTTFTFNDSESYIICGSSDGIVHLYDPRAEITPIQVSIDN